MENLQGHLSVVNPSSPPSGITWGSQTVIKDKVEAHYNIDTIHFCLHVEWPEPLIFLDQLEQLRLTSRRYNNFNPVPFSVPGLKMDFACYPQGKRGGYAYHISTGDVQIFFSKHDPNGNTPNVFVEVGSKSCWASGVETVFMNVTKFMEFFGGRVIKDSVNRADLACDVVGYDIKKLPYSIPKYVICKTDDYDPRYNNEGLKSLTMGEKGVVMLRMYDKVDELKESAAKQPLFAECWNVPTYDARPVTRVEYQLRKDILKEFKVRDFASLLQRIGGLWEYCVNKWFRLCSRVVDRSNPSRSRPHAFWKMVQGITWQGLRNLKRVKEFSQKTLNNLVVQAAGLAKTMGAMLRRKATDIDGIIAMAQGAIENELRKQFRENNTKFLYDFGVRLSECWCSL